MKLSATGSSTTRSGESRLASVTLANAAIVMIWLFSTLAYADINGWGNDEMLVGRAKVACAEVLMGIWASPELSAKLAGSDFLKVEDMEKTLASCSPLVLVSLRQCTEIKVDTDAARDCMAKHVGPTLQRFYGLDDGRRNLAPERAEPPRKPQQDAGDALFLIPWLGLSLGVGVFWRSKNLSMVAGVALSLACALLIGTTVGLAFGHGSDMVPAILGPICALAVGVVRKSKAVSCPHCAETIKIGARICKHCSQPVVASTSAASTP